MNVLFQAQTEPSIRTKRSLSRLALDGRDVTLTCELKGEGVRAGLQLEARHRVGQGLDSGSAVCIDLDKVADVAPVAPHDVDGERIRIRRKTLRLRVCIQAGGGSGGAGDHPALAGLVAVRHFGGGIGGKGHGAAGQRAGNQQAGGKHRWKADQADIFMAIISP